MYAGNLDGDDALAGRRCEFLTSGKETAGGTTTRDADMEITNTMGDNGAALTPREKRDGHVAGILQFLNFVLDPSQVVELRAIGVKGWANDPGHVEQGYFDSAHRQQLAETAYKLTMEQGATGVYFLLNVPDADLLATAANRVRRAPQGGATADKHIIRRRILPIDVDAERKVKTVSATDAEKAETRKVANSVREYLRTQGWPEPVVCDSGNGTHLLYRIDLPADDNGLVKRVLQSLANAFSTDGAKVDETLFNPARILKLIGTWARKGDHVEQRPHRLAKPIEYPDSFDVVPLEKLKALAGDAPVEKVGKSKPTLKSADRNAEREWTSKLKAEEFLSNRGIVFRR